MCLYTFCSCGVAVVENRSSEYFAFKFKKLKNERKLTLIALSEIIKIPMETLIEAEKGILPDPKFLIRISAAFDVNPSELILNKYLIPKKHELNYAIELMNLLSVTQILNRKLIFEIYNSNTGRNNFSNLESHQTVF